MAGEHNTLERESPHSTVPIQTALQSESAPSTAEHCGHTMSGTLRAILSTPEHKGCPCAGTGPAMLFLRLLMGVVENVMAQSAVEQASRLNSTLSQHIGPPFRSFLFPLHLPCSFRHFLLTLIHIKVYFDIINEHNKTGCALDSLGGFTIKSFYWAALLIYAVTVACAGCTPKPR